MTKQSIIIIMALFSMAISSAQDVRYFKLTSKEENGKSFAVVSGGQFITFIGDICYESNKKGLSVGHGKLTRNSAHSNSQYIVYQGQSYWGENTTFKFNADKSMLNVVIDKDNYYIYKCCTAPAGQETCSLIRETRGGGGGEIVVPPTPIIVDPYNPTPTPTPTPTPQPTPTPKPIPPTPQKTHKCGLCNGTGRTIKTNGTSFGKTKYCSECGKTVPDYHYHSNCESCGGKGYW